MRRYVGILRWVMNSKTIQSVSIKVNWVILTWQAHCNSWRMIDKITTNFISKSGGSAQAPLIINLSNNLLRFFKKSTTKLSHAIGQRSSETKLPINFNWKKSLGKATVRIELEFWWKFSQIVMREFGCGLNFEKTCWLFNYLREELELTGKEPTHLFLLHSRAKYTRKKSYCCSGCRQ